MNEYEAHLSSYDHSHKQRLKDMRQLTRDPMASEKARKAEAKANSGAGLISIKLGGDSGNSGGGGFKKGGFKKSGFKSAFVPVDAEKIGDKEMESERNKVPEKDSDPKVTEENVESDTDDEGYTMYDPRHPTDWKGAEHGKHILAHLFFQTQQRFTGDWDLSSRSPKPLG